MHKTQVKQNRKILLESCKKHLPKNVYRQLAKGIGNRQQVAISAEVAYKIAYAARPAHWYNQQARCRTTLQRYITRQILPKSADNRYATMTHDEIEKTCRKIMIDCFGPIADKFEIVTGNAILEAYRDGFGSKSCMTGDSAEIVKLYAENPDKVAMVKYHGDIDARALLWTTDSGQKILDRIYPNDGLHVEILRQWATDRGYIYRISTSLPSDTHVRLSDGENYTITLQLPDPLLIPYMDTFTFFDLVGHNKIVVANDKGCCEYMAQSVDGDYTTVGCYCSDCGDAIDPDDCHTYDGNAYCETCYQEAYICCDYCCDVEPRDGSVLFGGLIYCQYCADNHLTVCDNCDYYASNDDIRTVHDGNMEINVCCDCIDQYTECRDCGDYFDNTIEHDNDDYCNSCYAKIMETEKCTI